MNKIDFVKNMFVLHCTLFPMLFFECNILNIENFKKVRSILNQRYAFNYQKSR